MLSWRYTFARIHNVGVKTYIYCGDLSYKNDRQLDWIADFGVVYKSVVKQYKSR